MLFGKTNLRSTGLVSALLIAAFAFTAFISSAYQSQKKSLGERHHNEGQSLERKGALQAAVEEYRKALIFSPDNTDYRISFAAALIESGRLDEAESHIEQLLEENPTNGKLNRMRAQLAERENHIALAIDFYQRAVYEYWPRDKIAERAEARWDLVNLLEKNGRRGEAVGELMTLYANPSLSTESKVKVGFALLRDKANSEAAQIFRELTRNAPKDAEAHRGLAETYLGSGEYVSARHEFERALRLDPHNKNAAESLALTNTLIDIDPDLPGLTTSERFRRSQNLLRRVLGDLRFCSGGIEADDRFESADKLLKASASKISDAPLQMENLAKELWKDGAAICPDKLPSDLAVTRVLEGMSRE